MIPGRHLSLSLPGVVHTVRCCPLCFLPTTTTFPPPPPSPLGNDEQRLRALAKAAESISAGEVISSRLRRTNNWSLGPAANLLMGVVPTTYMRGNRELLGLPSETMNFPRFTVHEGGEGGGATWESE